MDSTTICNLALSRIGDQQIMSLDDPSMEARMCKLVYSPTVSELLRLRDWRWAMGLASLSQNAVDPDFDWAYSYALPNDFGRVVAFNNFDNLSAVIAYEIHGKNILTDEATAQLAYIKDSGDPNLFDAVFTECLVLRIASKLAKPLGGSMDITKQLNEEFQQYVQLSEVVSQKDFTQRRLVTTPTGFLGAWTSASICNMALARLGKATITSLTENSSEARLCNLFYKPTVSELLRLRDWSWAKAYASLDALLGPLPVSRWDRAYTLPGDFGRMISLNKQDDFASEYPYEINGNLLFTNETSASIQYVQNEVTESYFDGVFVDLLVCRLASKLVMSTGADIGILKVLDAEYAAYLQAAEKLAENESKDLRAAVASATPTPTSICNMALSKVSDKLINSLTDNTPAARLCNLFYAPAVAEVLRLHDWNWATGLASLSKYTLTASISVSTKTATGALANHGLAVGQSITVSGASNANVNGTWIIATAPTLNTFTFTLTESATGTYANANVVPAPPFDWDCSYALPSDFNRVVALNSFDAAQQNVNYEIVGRLLYTDESYANITYIKDTVDPSLFDSLFIDLLATKIAERIAPAMGVNPNVVQGLSVQFSRSLAAARRIDASEGDPRVKPYLVNSNLVNARYNGIY
jgi:hypothetical protein